MPFKLSEKTVDTLLDKLSSDDDFRELFQKNPREALAAVGHAPAADPSNQKGIWDCMQSSTLADKDQILTSRKALRDQLVTSQASYRVITVDI